MTLHLFLQSIRQPFEFQNGEPFSVLVVNLHRDHEQSDYFFRDNLRFMMCSLRTKEIGFIVALQDAGIIRDSYGRYVEKVAGRKLIPIQFDELYAKCLYQVSLLSRIPKFVTTTNDDPNIPTLVHMLPIGGFNTKPIVNEWVQADYAKVLAAILEQSYSDVDVDQLFVPPDQVMTWLTDEQGNLTLVDFDGKPIVT